MHDVEIVFNELVHSLLMARLVHWYRNERPDWAGGHTRRQWFGISVMTVSSSCPQLGLMTAGV